MPGLFSSIKSNRFIGPVSGACINLGATKGAGSSSRMLASCKNTGSLSCMEQFIIIKNPTPVPRPVPAPVPPPVCGPIDINTIVTLQNNIYILNNNVTILKCQTLTIVAGYNLYIENVLNNYGTIIVETSGTISNYGVINNYNNGTINNSGDIEIYDKINNSSGIIINNIGGTISIPLSNNVSVIPMLNNDLSSLINNSGTITNLGGSIYNSNNSVIVNETGGSIINNFGGIIYNYSDSTIDNTNGIINNIIPGDQMGGSIVNADNTSTCGSATIIGIINGTEPTSGCPDPYPNGGDVVIIGDTENLEILIP
jgi:hypothetical protein